MEVFSCFKNNCEQNKGKNTKAVPIISPKIENCITPLAGWEELQSSNFQCFDACVHIIFLTLNLQVEKGVLRCKISETFLISTKGNFLNAA